MPANTAVTLLLVLLLGACGDVHERLYMGAWTPAGEAALPRLYQPRPGETFRLVPIAQGDGPEIRPGSLVHARLVSVESEGPASDLPDCGPAVRAECRLRRSTTYDAWFWIGRERIDSGFGDPVLRAAFIGVRAGARLSLHLRNTVRQLPKRAFLLDYAVAPGGPGTSQRDSESAELRANPDARYEVEVLRVCEGRVLLREATLKQWGIIPYMWEGKLTLPFERQGTLRWLAVEGKCEAPAETLRFEKGPAYDATKGTLSASWDESYRQAIDRGRVIEASPQLNVDSK